MGDLPAPAPKQQKTQGRRYLHDQRQILGAVEPPPSSSSCSSSLDPPPVVSGDEKQPEPEPESELESESGSETLVPMTGYTGIDGHSLQSLLTTLSVSDIFGSDSDDDELFREDAARLAQGALNKYNEEEGVKYVVDDAGSTTPINFHGALLYHLNFTANKEEEDGPSRHQFFAEIVFTYPGGCDIPACIKMDTIAPELVRKGCIYCPEHVEHPPVEMCEYGTNEKEDEEKLEGPGT